MTVLLHFEFMVAAGTSLNKSITGGLAFLSREQDGSGMISRGAWPTRVQRNKQSWTDRNAFVTALIVETLTPLARRSCVARMLDTARAFLRTCAVESPAGGYGFWSKTDPKFRAAADLDDTALVRGVLRDREAGHFDGNEAMRLFSAYRATRGTELAAPARWTTLYSGVFTTWMAEGRPTVDVAVNANVVAYLRSIGVEVPGMQQAEAMIGFLLESGDELERFAPYYPSRAFVLFRCAVAGRAGATFARSLEGRLVTKSRETPSGPSDALLLASACTAAGLKISPSDSATIATPLVDGGWPAISVCTDFTGRTLWTSRPLATALAVALLAYNKI